MNEAEQNADHAAPSLQETTSRVEAYLDFQIPLQSGASETDSDLKDIADWANQPCSFTGTSILTDTTTIFSLTGSLNGARMTPLALWDLARIINAMISYDNIFFFAHPEVDPAALNTKLGEDIFRPLVLPTEGPAYDPRGVRGLINTAWMDTDSVSERLLRAVGTDTFEGKAAIDLARQWSVALGQSLTPTDVIGSKLAGTLSYRSPGGVLISTFRELGTTTERIENSIRVAKMTEAFPDLLEVEEEDLRRAIRESNHRGHVNERLARHLNTGYLPNASRIPFRNTFYDRARVISDNLPSLDALDAYYAERASQARLLTSKPFVVPVFLALALSHISKPEDLWEEVGALRTRAAGYRRRREALDSALEQGDLDETRRTIEAIRTEASRLSSLLIDSAHATASAAIAAVEANPVSFVAASPVDWAAKTVTFLIAGARKLLPDSVMKRLAWKAFRPEFRFLSDISTESRAITNAFPKVAKVWGVPKNSEADFVARFAEMGKFS